MNTASRCEFCFLDLVWMSILAWVCSGSMSSQVEFISKQQLLHTLLCFPGAVEWPAEAVGQPLSWSLYRFPLSVRDTDTLAQEANIIYLLCRDNHLLRLFFLNGREGHTPFTCSLQEHTKFYWTRTWALWGCWIQDQCTESSHVSLYMQQLI